MLHLPHVYFQIKKYISDQNNNTHSVSTLLHVWSYFKFKYLCLLSPYKIQIFRKKNHLQRRAGEFLLCSVCGAKNKPAIQDGAECSL